MLLLQEDLLAHLAGLEHHHTNRLASAPAPAALESFQLLLQSCHHVDVVGDVNVPHLAALDVELLEAACRGQCVSVCRSGRSHRHVGHVHVHAAVDLFDRSVNDNLVTEFNRRGPSFHGLKQKYERLGNHRSLFGGRHRSPRDCNNRFQLVKYDFAVRGQLGAHATRTTLAVNREASEGAKVLVERQNTKKAKCGHEQLLLNERNL